MIVTDDYNTTSWVAHPGSQQVFLCCPVYEVLFEGTRGPGKTEALLMDFAQHVGQGFGDYWRGILFRQTYKQLSDVIAKSRRWFKRFWGNEVKFNASDYTWTFPDGAQLLLRHMKAAEDYDNYHGHEYPWIGWEELTNWPSGDLYEAMKSCCRASHPGMPRKYRATCNPFGVGHNWVKKRFIDPAARGSVITDENGLQRVAIHGSMLENKHLMKNDPDYRAKLAAIKSAPKRKAWLFGAWDINAGGMFDEVWDVETHFIKPFRIPDSWWVDRSMDWGSSRPFSVGWWARSDGSPALMADGAQRTFPRGTLFRIHEWYGYNGERNVGLQMLATDVARGIVLRDAALRKLQANGVQILSERHVIQAGPADSQIFDDRPGLQKGNSIAKDMESQNVWWEPSIKSKNSRKNGWELCRIRLANCPKHDPLEPEKWTPGELPGLYVFNTCDQFLETFPSLPRDQVDMDDVDTESEDHIGDEVRYRVLHEEREVSQRPMYGNKR